MDTPAARVAAANPLLLNIAIVGGGVGGLTAAIGLRRNGHRVFEKSSDSTRGSGAAIHLCPNANGILRQMGIYAESFGACSMSRYIELTKDGHTFKDVDLTEANKRWPHPWQLVLRAALYQELKRIATSEEGDGVPVDLVFSCQIIDVDPQRGALTMPDGREHQADVIIGADGIYSTARRSIKDVKLLPTGKAAFRFVIPRSAAESDPLTAPLVSQKDALTMWFGDDRRVVMYVCDDNEQLNLVLIHPDVESHAVPEDEWTKDASVEQVLSVYRDFDPRLKALIRKASSLSLKVWQLLDMEKLPRWVSGKMALLGDAAHPCLPYQAQGAAQAIEDAAALSVVLPGATAPGEVHDRLRLYESIRYERAHTVQEYSRLAGQDWVDGKPVVDMRKFETYNFGHDEFANAAEYLALWERSHV
ncbi:hypothetical protein C8A03DRAFT_44961 [Achaetomium macrosporum]|uniref:FAD-binding domain-containing protein n=1 Tax=Achaetomium macrosporum TaxID=79813 RepID=A0AAN7H6C6_9PEZI|nr:hypothetical protein C8A03DRAFT_44961 [Achaetomium macrosporum]